MIEQFSKFPATELQVGHVLAIGVAIMVWGEHDETMGDMILVMTAAGVGHAFPKDQVVENVIGRVSDEMVEILKTEFVENYVDMFGEPPEPGAPEA